MLAERAKIPVDTLYRAYQGRLQTLDFDVADRLVCAMGLPMIWHEDPELRAVYEPPKPFWHTKYAHLPWPWTCSRGHTYEGPEDVYWTSQGRHCRVCNHRRAVEYRKKHGHYRERMRRKRQAEVAA